MHIHTLTHNIAPTNTHIYRSYKHTNTYAHHLGTHIHTCDLIFCLTLSLRVEQLRREISYEISGSHWRAPLAGRSLICNEPAPPVIILRLRDHAQTHLCLYARFYGCVGTCRYDS